jgi:hypothetical protein
MDLIFQRHRQGVRPSVDTNAENKPPQNAGTAILPFRQSEDRQLHDQNRKSVHSTLFKNYRLSNHQLWRPTSATSRQSDFDVDNLRNRDYHSRKLNQRA